MHYTNRWTTFQQNLKEQKKANQNSRLAVVSGMGMMQKAGVKAAAYSPEIGPYYGGLGVANFISFCR
jgi:hypothetical protein